MLGAIRNKSKGWVAYLIVGLITVPFALFGIQDYAARSANTSIAKVDGEDIDINIYYQELNSQQRNLQQQLGAAYTQEIVCLSVLSISWVLHTHRKLIIRLNKLFSIL